MKYKDFLNRQMFFLIIQSLFIIFIIIYLSILLGRWLLSNNKDTYVIKDVVVDIDSLIDKKLEKVTDIEGINLESNDIMLTNNSNVNKDYQVLLCGNDNYKEDIRISLNKSLVKSLNKFNYNNSCFEILNSSLEPYSSNELKFSIWNKKSSNIKDIYVKYTLKVNIN